MTQKEQFTQLDNFIFREIHRDEIEEASEIEQLCFPPHEACSRMSMEERILRARDHFLIAYDPNKKQIAGFLNGIATDESVFRDEFFTDASLHVPTGSNIMLLGLDVRPEYRHRGLGHALMEEYAKREEVKGRQALFLTCLEEKVSFYEGMCFRDLGIANSTWGGESWHEMKRDLSHAKDIVAPCKEDEHDWTKHATSKTVDIPAFVTKLQKAKDGEDISWKCPFCGGMVTVLEQIGEHTVIGCNQCDMRITLDS